MNQNVHTNEFSKQLVNKVDVMVTHYKIIKTQISQVAQQQEVTIASVGVFPGHP